MDIELQDEGAQRVTVDEHVTQNVSLVQEVNSRLKAHAKDQACWRPKELAEIKAKKAKALKKHRAAHEETMELLCASMSHCEELLKLVREVVKKLKCQRMRGFPALQVCNLRQELRSKLPPSETLNDGLQIALEAEEKLLKDSRVEMLDLEKEGTSIVEELSSMRTCLLEGVGAWRMHSDQFIWTLKGLFEAEVTSLWTATDTWKASIEEWDSSPEDAEHRMRASRLVDKTGLLFARSEKLYLLCGEVVKRVACEQKIALSLVESKLGKRAADLAKDKRELELQVVQADRAIVYAEDNVNDIAREVQEKKVGVERLESDLQAIADLRKSKESLSEQVRIKFAALQIENACRRVTPASADGTKQSLRAGGRSNIRSPSPTRRGDVREASPPQQGKTSQSSTSAVPPRSSSVGASGASSPRMSKAVSKAISMSKPTTP